MGRKAGFIPVMKEEKQPDRLDGLLDLLGDKPAKKEGFKDDVWARIQSQSDSDDPRIIRPRQFMSKVPRVMWSGAAAAVIALMALPLANLNASQVNASRLEAGKERYIESLVSRTASHNSHSPR